MIDSRFVRALRALLPSLLPTLPYLGPRKYRVVAMVPSASSATLTRYQLQIVNRAVGFPDELAVPAWPGLAGSRAEVTPGSLALVEFIDADPQQPIVTHWTTADDPAWMPVNLVFDATGKIKIGASATEIDQGKALGANVREGDTVSITPGNGAGPVAGIITVTLGLGIPPAKSIVKS